MRTSLLNNSHTWPRITQGGKDISSRREWSKKSALSPAQTQGRQDALFHGQGHSPFGARSVLPVREHCKRARTPLAAFFNISRIGRYLYCFALLLGLSLLPCLNAVYGSEIIRVALEQQADRVDIVSTDLFQIQLSSHKSVTQRGPFTIRPDGDLLEIAGHRVRVKNIRIRGKSPTMKVSLTPGSAGEWVIGGNIHITRQGSRLQVVNRLDVEEYVTGVVASEISSSWHPEALKAQAVAARTYVLYKKMLNSENDFDVVASVQDQVYTGHQQVTESIKEAIKRTRGQVITFERRPIFAAYSSTACRPD